MVNGLDFNKHLAFTSSEDVKDISKPLLDCYGLSYFNYVKIYKNSEHITLTTNPYWLKHFFDKQYHKVVAFEKLSSSLDQSPVIWDLFEEDNAIRHDEREYFQIDHGATLINSTEEYNEFYYFATKPGNYGIMNFYINQSDILRNFVDYFKDQAGLLIDKAEKEKFKRS